MNTDAKIFIAAGAIAAFLAVALGAFGAHALRERLPPDLLAIYHTGVEYHFWHALGLLAIGLTAGLAAPLPPGCAPPIPPATRAAAPAGESAPATPGSDCRTNRSLRCL